MCSFIIPNDEVLPFLTCNSSEASDELFRLCKSVVTIIPHQKHQRFVSELTAFCVGVDCVFVDGQNVILKKRKRNMEEGENAFSSIPKTCFRFFSVSFVSRMAVRLCESWIAGEGFTFHFDSM
jgi:hypothetical protein